ncbi:FecR family protein [Puia dinghuensis]|uniref:FecR family protein n=1 Tax=Puia dinghuensis TaxID=1792502 RepID=A0A8J2XRN4_9BACT|nr:FecR family protein [Puia dinghuensis]GGA89721.1 hypothetical protein GCM10011511_11200 [Puia dinghuensis]
MPTPRTTYLLQQYLDKTISEEELAELSLLLQDEAAGEDLQQAMEGLLTEAVETRPLEMRPRRRVIPLRRIGWWAAAAVLILVAGGLWIGESGNKVKAPVVAVAHDAAPGGNKALLTLGDGSTVRLDEVKAGVVGRQGNTQVIKSKDAQLQYEVAGDSGAVQYNVLATPRGGQYKLVLPDGTKVWLDAATTIRYPTAFAGAERVVELNGEAYFEVAADAAKPFRVEVATDKGQMQVDVLGTHFNIMSYADEPVVKTTLLEGSVRVRKGGKRVQIRPGEQARLNGDGSLVVVKTDVEEAVAWKNGLFKFEEADMQQVMRQLSRWYDLEVVYTNGVPKDRFQGEMYRDVNLSKILKILEASGVRFTVEGKKLLVQ